LRALKTTTGARAGVAVHVFDQRVSELVQSAFAEVLVAVAAAAEHAPDQLDRQLVERTHPVGVARCAQELFSTNRE